MADLIEPFDMTAMTRDELGIKHFDELPSSLVTMLRTSVEEEPDRDAVVQLD
jgi:hypothetical protein